MQTYEGTFNFKGTNTLQFLATLFYKTTLDTLVYFLMATYATKKHNISID